MGEHGRTFLGWEPGHTRRAAQALAAMSPNPTRTDLAHLTVVTPGSRAARTTLAELIDESEHSGRPLTPPLFITPSEITAACLGPTPNPPATPTHRRLCWIDALRRAPSGSLDPLIPFAPHDEHDDQWNTIARWAQSTCEDLAAQALTPRDVLTRAEHLLAPTEAQRWETLAALHDAYSQHVNALCLDDERATALAALATDPTRPPTDLVLLGVTEIPYLARRVIEHASTHTHALVFAPEEHVQGFDELGLIVPEHWTDLQTPAVDADSISFVATPAQSARAALLHTALSADTITDAAIGLADERLLPVLKHQAAISGIDKVHAPSELTASRSAPATLLKGIADFAANPSLEHASSLLRHPHAAAWIASKTDTSATTLTRALQRARSDHVQTRGTLIPPAASQTTRAAAEASLQPLRALLDPISSPDPAPYKDWCAALERVLESIYDAAPPAPEDADILERIAAELHLGATSTPESPVPCSTLFAVLSERLDETRTSAEHRDTELESLGWLELLHDPSPVCAVMGMSDPHVPHAPPRDPLVTLAIREALALPTPHTTLARDIYLARAIDASRSARFIASRRSPTGDPEPPSRVLLHAPPDECALRTRRATTDTPDTTTRLTRAHSPATHDAFLPYPTIDEGYTPPESMNVTEFDTYLRSPAAWYYERARKLHDPDHAPREMNPMVLGNLAHNALERFGLDESARDLTRAADIADALDAHLSDAITHMFAPPRAAAVSVQCELLRHRLRLLADHQCERRNQGWRITHTELRSEHLDTQPQLATLTAPMPLRARVDRIDVHEDTKQWCVLDYKTGKPTDADKAHRDKHGHWTKLQLPLYALVTRAMGHPGTPALGYATVPSTETDAVFTTAPWNEDDLLDAHAVASTIVDEIRALTPGSPLSLGDHPPSDGFMGFLTAERFKTAGRPAPPKDEDDTQGGTP